MPKEKAEIVTSIPDATFVPVHPTETAGRPGRIKGRDLPPSQGNDGDESRFVRCKQCGWIVDRDTPLGSGWGNITHQTITGAPVNAPKDPIVGGAGCPFCGGAYES